MRTEVAGALHDVHAALERVFDRHPESVGRLHHQQTTVSLGLREDPGGERVTLLLDRRVPELTWTRDPAEIDILLTPQQAACFAAGRLAVPAGIVAGEIGFEGPVRGYLQVDPILRGLLADLHAEAGTAVPPRPAAAPIGAQRFDADLLAIETRDLHKGFGGTPVLSGVDLKIPEGVVSVVLGPSGTGKSVLLQHIIGLLTPDAGDVLVRGRALGSMSRSEMLDLRTEIGVMFQDGALFSTMDVYDNVAFPLRQHTDLREPKIREIVLEQLALVGLGHATNRLPNQLSGGMRKRAGLARALVLDPGIVLCDEPDSGLDPVRTALLGDLLLEQHERVGGTMVVITHNIALAKYVSDHISVLWQGKVLEAGLAQHIVASGSDFVRQFLAGDSTGPLGME
jgi:phospholipid/cholesterol/gamma-HCH transport system ATP-binding protein